MQRDVLRGRLERLRHLRLRQPDSLPLGVALDARSAILGLVEDQFGAALGGIAGHPDLGMKPVRPWSAPVNVMLSEAPTSVGGSSRAGATSTIWRRRRYGCSISSRRACIQHGGVTSLVAHGPLARRIAMAVRRNYGLLGTVPPSSASETGARPSRPVARGARRDRALPRPAPPRE